LAVAAGKPFLDMPTAQGNVLLVDFENSLTDVRWIMDRQRKHLRLEECPHAFQVWPMHLDPLRQRVEQVIAAFAPDLVILDSLRSFNPIMGEKGSAKRGRPGVDDFFPGISLGRTVPVVPEHSAF
jgi:hypothetical protein